MFARPNTGTITLSRPLLMLAACYAVGLVLASMAVGAEPMQPNGGGGSVAGRPDSRYTVTIKSGENLFVGHPIRHDSFMTVLLRRNGRLKIFRPTEVDKYERVAATFSPKSARQLRVELQKEFGSKYEVSLTRHFVVVHPPGAYKRWALPFEQFYVRYRQWFTSRGLQLDHPEFPMVAIVLRNRGEYNRFASRYLSFGYSTAGYYSSESNRMITYDTEGGRNANAVTSSFATMTTVIHEATHQTSFNVGIHHRYYAQPKWFKEGLATLFEAPGINNPAANSSAKDRIEPQSLRMAKAMLKQSSQLGLVEAMVRSDGLFKASPDAAYAVSWAMTAYLTEKYPRNYVRYIKLLRDEPFESGATPDSRLRFFQQAFGPPDRIEGGLRTYVTRLQK